MGHGRWAREQFDTYARVTGRIVREDGVIAGNYTAQEMYTSRALHPKLNPKGVIRECCDTNEHPETIPVILALDVTGSMGQSAVEIAKKLNVIMTDLYTKVKDVEFMIMGIGDVMYDRAPIQASQFESDIRIAEQLDLLYFEGGGGGNYFESYTGAWYFAAHHTRLDCWKRGKKGIIITIGDEPCNPYIPLDGRYVNFANYMGDTLQGDVDTADLLRDVREKYDLYHLVVEHNAPSKRRATENVNSFARYIGKDHVKVVTVESLTNQLVSLIVAHSKNQAKDKPKKFDWMTCNPADFNRTETGECGMTGMGTDDTRTIDVAMEDRGMPENIDKEATDLDRMTDDTTTPAGRTNEKRFAWFKRKNYATW